MSLMPLKLGLLFLCIVTLGTACASRESTARNANALDPLPVTSTVPLDYNGATLTNPNASPSPQQSKSTLAEIDNQMSVKELREKLDEVKAIERQTRKMVVLRNNWEEGVAECMRIMEELKPRARAATMDYKRMLSPAGIEIANAAMNLNVCVNCLENDDDTDCRFARESIAKAEKELKKEMRLNK